MKKKENYSPGCDFSIVFKKNPIQHLKSKKSIKILFFSNKVLCSFKCSTFSQPGFQEHQESKSTIISIIEIFILMLASLSLTVKFCRGKKICCYIYTLLFKCPVTVAFYFTFQQPFLSQFLSQPWVCQTWRKEILDFDTWNQFSFTFLDWILWN